MISKTKTSLRFLLILVLTIVSFEMQAQNITRLRCKTLCDVLYDTLGEFGAIQAQAVAKIFILNCAPKVGHNIEYYER